MWLRWQTQLHVAKPVPVLVQPLAMYTQLCIQGTLMIASKATISSFSRAMSRERSLHRDAVRYRNLRSSLELSCTDSKPTIKSDWGILISMSCKVTSHGIKLRFAAAFNFDSMQKHCLHTCLRRQFRSGLILPFPTAIGGRSITFEPCNWLYVEFPTTSQWFSAHVSKGDVGIGMLFFSPTGANAFQWKWRLNVGVGGCIGCKWFEYVVLLLYQSLSPGFVFPVCTSAMAFHFGVSPL